MTMIFSRLHEIRESGRKALAVLIDPDKTDEHKLNALYQNCAAGAVDLILVGGSLMVTDRQKSTIGAIRAHCNSPLVLFPGNSMYIDGDADAILFLSLISGRNPEYLIGQHVVAAPLIRSAGIEPLPTGYILVGHDRNTTVAYMSNTQPIPPEKADIAASTAMAGEMLGLKIIYLDAGSGASQPVPVQMIRRVRASVASFLIVGGGIDTPEKAYHAFSAGADMIVIGNGAENSTGLVPGVARVVAAFNRPLDVHQ
jgi:putative glycerol-1-phosphate prenyltransferase